MKAGDQAASPWHPADLPKLKPYLRLAKAGVEGSNPFSRSEIEELDGSGTASAGAEAVPDAFSWSPGEPAW